MPDLKDYECFTRPIQVPLINGDTLTVHYCPARYNTQFNRDSAGGAMPDEVFLFHMLGGDARRKDPVKGATEPVPLADQWEASSDAPPAGRWDWTEAGKMVPITIGFLRTRVAVPDRIAMVQAMVGDIFPTSPEATTDTEASSDTTSS